MSFFDGDYDDFWDVSKLVPKKKTTASRFSANEKISDVILDSCENKKYSSDDKKLNFSLYQMSDKTESSLKEYSYVPSFAKLIRKVTIKPSVDRFDFYDTFRKAALIYFDYKCPKCDFVPFYSYMPQYSQMTTEQKRYYFYWRDELRKGRYLKIDYSYIYLYAYEILNLPEKVGKEEGLSLLCDVWCAYRKELPRLDGNFSVWVQDYCLVYGLECPFDKIKDFLFDVINVSSFKEFYLSDMSKGGNGASAMIAYLSDYDWRRGKYAGGDNSDVYRKHVEGAMQCIFSKILTDDAVLKSEHSKISRTAFPGSLCTHTVKCILEIEYYSISHSPQLRASVTAALKYTENKLRACLGVKSRLAIKYLPDEFKASIDKYFESEFRRLERERERANAPEYERLYDAPEVKASFESAVEIEKASWRMTARLVEGMEDFEEASYEEPAYKKEIRQNNENTEMLSETAEEKNDNCKWYGLDNIEISFLRAALKTDTKEQKKIANESGIPADTLAENINEAFSDNFGDVILEQSDIGGFKVIDDYYEEITEWLQ